MTNIPDILERYETTDGGRLVPEWAGTDVSVTPQDIREHLRFAKKYALACLAKDREASFDPAYWAVARRYFAKWPEYRKWGKGPLFIGDKHAGTSWTAAAVVNEIVTHTARRNLASVSAAWLSTFHTLRLITDADRQRNTDVYFLMRDRMWKTQLLVVDDLLGAAGVEGGVDFLKVVYAYRDDYMLPTITTITTSSPATYLADVAAIFGRAFVWRLLDSTKDELIAIHGSAPAAR